MTINPSAVERIFMLYPLASSSHPTDFRSCGFRVLSFKLNQNQRFETRDFHWHETISKARYGQAAYVFAGLNLGNVKPSFGWSS